MKFVHSIKMALGSPNWMILAILFCLSYESLLAGGIRQVAPTEADSPVMLETGNPNFNSFADFNGPERSRLQITIDNLNEKIFLGLSVEYNDEGEPFSGTFTGQYRFQIKDPNGVVVHGPFLINNNNANISDWAGALFGNYPVTATQSGNLMYEFQPAMTGDFYLEFDDATFPDGDPKVNIPFWDITVANNNVPIEGRVWSKSWAFRTPLIDGTDLEECEWDRPFNGDLYSYTTDGFVSRINFQDAGMQGLSFNVVFNSKGPGVSGNLVEDRKSVPGVNASLLAAEHKIFLYPPDPLVFLDGECGEITTPTSFNCLTQDSFCLQVSVTKPGQVEVILDFNQNGILDPGSEDVNLVYEFPEGQLSACIPWDGLSGMGNPVTVGDTIDLIFFYSQGIQHWSAYDVEYLKNGYCIETIRPLCEPNLSSSLLFWDDSNIAELPGNGSVQDGRNGCACETGCRTWDNFELNLEPGEDCGNVNDNNTTGYGDKSTINTWWFANTTSVVRVNIPLVQGTIVGPDSVCLGDNAVWVASDIGASGNVTFDWTGPNNFSANTAQVTISEPGEYCVDITDNLGCQTNVCKTLSIIDSGSDLISVPSVLTACLNETVQINTTGNTSLFTFQWTPSTGLDFDNIPNPSFTLTGNTSYSVEVENIVNGCTFTRTVEVNQFPQPVPSFTTQTGCEQGLTINFNNTSANATAYSWSFGDPTTTTDVSTDENPSYTYPAPGTYPVILVSTSADGCTVTLTQNVTVMEVPLIAGFDISYNSCNPDAVEVQFTNTSINGANNTSEFSWVFSGGNGTSDQENPTVTITSATTILVTLTITTADGCTATDSQAFEVNLGPPADQFPAELTVCAGVPTQIMPAGDPAFSYTWSPATGIDDINSPQPTFTPLVSTVYSVIISAAGAAECSVVETVAVDIAPPINLQVLGAGTFCTATTTLTATTDVSATIEWFLGSTSVNTGNVFTPAISGPATYIVVATDTNGCTQESAPVTISGGPPNISVPDSVGVCFGAQVILNVSNLDANDNLTYLWSPANLFDPTTLTLASPTYIGGSGTAIVTVTATNQFGCSLDEDVIVYMAPAIDLQVTGGGNFCTPTTTLNATTAIPATIQWFVEPSGDLVNMGNTFTPTLSGTTTYTLVADDGTGCPTETVTVTVSGGPPNISLPDSLAVCFGEMVNLSVTNLDPNDTLTYLWSPANLFNPATTTQASPIYIGDDGTQTVTVTATNQFGCSLSEEVVIYTAPDIELQATGGNFCTPTTTLTATTAIPATIQWFDANNILVNTGASYTPTLSGTDVYTLIADDGTDCQMDTIMVTVSGGPVDISVPDTVAVCLGEDILLDVINLDSNDTLTYLWAPASLFVAGTETNASPDFIEAIGEYDVSVTVTSQFGCTATENVRVAVVDPDIALSFTSEIDCNGGTVTFTNTSTNAFGYVWNFGDGSPLNYEENPTHTYMDEGTYTVTLDIVYDVSCAEAFSLDVMVEEPQIFAGFTYDIVECSADSAVIAFVDVSSNTLNNTIGWSWTFLDATPASSMEQNPTVVVSTEGPLVVSLTISTANNCSNTITETLNIDLIDLDISLTDTIVLCLGDTTVLNPTGDPSLTYSWSPTDFLSDPTATSPQAFPSVTTTYVATAYSTVGTDTCFVTDQVVVFVPAAINLMLDQDPVVVTCGEDVVITATADVEVTIDWVSVLDGSLANNSPTITVNPFRTDTIIATATDEFGCMAMDTIIVIDNGVDIEIAEGNDITACQGVDTILTVVNLDVEDMVTYEWSPLENIIGTNTDDTVQIIVNELGTTVFTVIATNQNDCMDTIMVNVMVQEFEGDLADTVYVCYNEPTPINPGGNDTYMYDWSPTTGLDLTNPSNPIATLTEDQLYQVSITDPVTGCSDELEVLVIVYPDLGLTTEGTINVCTIEPVELTASTLIPATVVWYLENDSIGTGNSITVIPPGDGCFTYTAIATDPETGCEQSSDEIVCVMEFMGVLPDDVVTVCADEPTPINPGGNPDFVYEWSPEDEFIDLTEIGPWNPVVTTNMPLTYFVTVTDPEFGCTVTDTIDIEIAPQLNLNISPESVVLCDSIATTLTANTDFAPSNVTWFLLAGDTELGTGTELTFIPPSGENQVYAVATSPDGCTERDTINVNNVPIDATITAALIICEATDTEQLSVINNNPAQDLTIEWGTPGVLTALDEFTVTVDPNITTEFNATVTNQYGCSETLSTTVTVIDLLGDLSISADPDTILLTESSTITVEGCIGCDYDWSPPNDNSPVITVSPTEIGENEFFVTVSLLECSLDLSQTVFVVDGTCDADHVFFPNAFTPNRDGDNDILRISSAFLDELTDMELLVYNRWGEEMFRTIDQFQGWDGTYRGEDLPPDVYGYYLRVVCPNGDELVQKGNVTLLR